MKAIFVGGVALAAFAATGLSAQSGADQRQMAQENFRIADQDNNGKLNRAEFKTFIDANAEDGLGRASMVRRMGAYNTAFKRADANGDGAVTRNEIATAVRKK